MLDTTLDLELGPGWAQALAPVRSTLVAALSRAAADRANGARILPASEQVLRAFHEPFDAVRVVIVGQDPYPTPGHAMGLAFSAAPGTRRLPASLRNIVRELTDDIGGPPPTDGDLRPWAEQGVLLLNRVLTVRAGRAGSHRGIGWEAVTAHALQALTERGKPLVAVLWGRDAERARPLLGTTPTIVCAHPSPLSARRGFFGSRPFSRANELLEAQGAAPINWRLP